MTAIEIIPALKDLSRREKLKIMKFLIHELETEEGKEEETTLKEGVTYAIWSPLNSHKAAVTLTALLDDE